MPDVGTLQVSLVSNRGKRPITDAAVEISSAGEPDKILEVLKTDLSGQTEVIELETPPLEYSMEPRLNQPYSEYNLKITAQDLSQWKLQEVRCFPGSLLCRIFLWNRQLQKRLRMKFLQSARTHYMEIIHQKSQRARLGYSGNRRVVLSRVVIPEYVIVHDGAVSDNTAKNYYVLYKIYIKNVSFLRNLFYILEANILAIMSFTLNRVYTEWYRGKGKTSPSHHPPPLTKSGLTAKTPMIPSAM